MSLADQPEYVFDPANLKPQWSHPYIVTECSKTLTQSELTAFAYDFYLRFLPLFKNQPEGCLSSGVVIEVSKRLKNRLGYADLFNKRIALNANYFCSDPRLLPYSLFHELVHQWLYDCYCDPGHTKTFYRKMRDFASTGLPIDRDVHIHRRLPEDSKYLYACPSCKNRWYTNTLREAALECGYCFEKHNVRITPSAYRNPRHATPARGPAELPYFSRACV